LEGKTSLWGIQVHVMARLLLPPNHIPPDFQCGFDITVKNDLIHMVQKAIAKYVPFGKEGIDLIFTILGKFGISFPKPYFVIKKLKLRKFSMVRFFGGLDPFVLEWDFTFFGQRWQSEIRETFPTANCNIPSDSLLY
jgi:hypothetical protein